MAAGRPRLAWAALLAGALSLAVVAGCAPGAGNPGAAPARVPAQVVSDDAGDARATTTYDGRMVRRRVALAIHPLDGADRGLLRRQLTAAAAAEHVGPLTDATFAVFSPELLKYLVPEVVVVLPERATVQDAEILMKDHSYPGVGFYLAESVLVHDLAFAVLPDGRSPADVRARADREGVLTDSLGKYGTSVRKQGLVVTYFGAVLSDGQILAVRESLARAAAVGPDRVIVTPMLGDGGVDLSAEPAQPPAAHGH